MASEFRHEALFYQGERGFLEATVPFIRAGVRAAESTLVVVSSERIALLRERLGEDAAGVTFADMASVGQNPARIIPAWQDFVDRNAGSGRQLRGIGEPIWPARSGAELAECQLHEALLNLAFAAAPRFWLLCPYDRSALAPDVIREAERSHSFVMQEARSQKSAAYAGLSELAEAAPLPTAPETAVEEAFDSHSLRTLRAAVMHQAARAGLRRARMADLVIAVNEVATNSVLHGGGTGRLRIWRDGASIVCEIRDEGRIRDPLADRRRPRKDPRSPRGLWLANQLCDLVQVRGRDGGTAVRLRMRAA
jgi:anti-sigma regulatory factor (Ser/Thr protein kinase)